MACLRYFTKPRAKSRLWEVMSTSLKLIQNFLLEFTPGSCILMAGRAIAQAFSFRHPTAAARVRVRVRSRGISIAQSGTGAGFLRVHRFPLQIRIPPIAPQLSSSIIWGW
jgi:hypothetical protein